MSKIEVINFEEKVRKMKRSSKVNGFSGMIKMLRHSVDVFEFVGEDVEERLQKYSNLVGKDSKDFMLNRQQSRRLSPAAFGFSDAR